MSLSNEYVNEEKDVLVIPSESPFLREKLRVKDMVKFSKSSLSFLTNPLQIVRNPILLPYVNNFFEYKIQIKN